MNVYVLFICEARQRRMRQSLNDNDNLIRCYRQQNAGKEDRRTLSSGTFRKVRKVKEKKDRKKERANVIDNPVSKSCSITSEIHKNRRNKRLDNGLTHAVEKAMR